MFYITAKHVVEKEERFTQSKKESFESLITSLIVK